MTPPIDGMKMRPWGDDFMAPAFLGLVSFCAQSNDHLGLFLEKHPGCTPPRTPIERMIDKACGRAEAVFATFADWVAETQWGLEESEEPTPLPEPPQEEGK